MALLVFRLESQKVSHFECRLRKAEAFVCHRSRLHALAEASLLLQFKRDALTLNQWPGVGVRRYAS